MKSSHNSLFKEYANLLTGTWQLTKGDVTIIFDLAQGQKQYSAITIYREDIAFIGRFYLEVSRKGKTCALMIEIYDRVKYTIHMITPSLLVLQESSMKQYVYERKSNISYADEIIQNCFQKY